MSVVEVKDLVRNYGAFCAVNRISFSIQPGEIVGLLGPNGAGKSTTMKVLTGYLAPTSGRVTVAGHDVLAEPLAVQSHLGYLPENAPIYQDMSVGSYLQFIGRVRKLGRAERARAMVRVADECGLSDRISQRISTLSRGYRQRVGLAQALLHSPRLLILDEPTNGLDPNQIVEIRSLIRRVGETRTVILSTHILSEVQVSCDRVIIIHEGKIVADGATADVTAHTSGHRLSVGLGAGKVKASESQILKELRALPGVSRAESAAAIDESLRFTLVATCDVREIVFQWAVVGGHVLLELSAERTNLEEVFRSLTVTEGAA